MAARRSRLWWLPLLTSAVLLSPLLTGLSLYLLGDAFYLAVWAGGAAAVAAGLLLARWFRAPAWGAGAFALLAAAVAVWTVATLLSGVR